MKTKTLSTRHYKAGYEIRTEEVQLYEGDDVSIRKHAYTPEGWNIGSPKDAYRLCVKFGIKPELHTRNMNICAVGFCESESKWYGWSHRAIYGFGIGSTTKVGDCGYVPDDVNKLAEEYKDWNDSVEVINDTTIRVSNRTRDVVGENEDGALILSDSEQSAFYEVETGRGEWVAETIEDAREMACDFASGVS